MHTNKQQQQKGIKRAVTAKMQHTLKSEAITSKNTADYSNNNTVYMQLCNK